MKATWLILGLFLLTGCADGALPTNPIYSEASAMQLSPVATGTPSPTGTSSPTASPTQIDWGPIWIAQTEVALTQQVLDQAEQKLQIDLTQVWVDEQNRNGTSTAAVETATQRAADTLTPEAWALATSSAEKTGTPEAIENEKEAATVKNIEITNRWMPVIFGAILLVIVLAGMMVVSFLKAGVEAKRAERKLYQDTAKRPEQEERTPLVPQDTDLGQASTWVARELPAGLTVEKMKQVAQRYFEYGTFSRALVEVQKILTDGEWDSLIEFASHPGRKYIVPRNPAVKNSGWNWEPNGKLWLKSF